MINDGHTVVAIFHVTMCFRPAHRLYTYDYYMISEQVVQVLQLQGCSMRDEFGSVRAVCRWGKKSEGANRKWKEGAEGISQNKC